MNRGSNFFAVFAVVAVWGAVTRFLAQAQLPLALPMVARIAGSAVLSGLLLWAAICFAAGEEETSTKGLAAVLLERASKAWIPLLPLLGLGWMPAAEGITLVPGLLISISFLLLGLRGSRALVFSSDVHEKTTRCTAPFNLMLLGASLAIGAYYIVIGTRARGVLGPDTLYYFGMAKTILATKSLGEPIVWQFVHAPDSVVHSAFGHWGPVPSFALLPPMWLFGPTEHVANITMSVVSALSVLAFWFLLTECTPFLGRVPRALALLIFALSPSMAFWRFKPETIPFAHLFLVLALIALARRKYAWTVAFGFLVFLTRGDCALLFVALAGLSLVLSWKQGRRSLAVVAATGLLLVGAYVTRNLVSFGSIAPPGGDAAFLARYYDLYAYQADGNPPMVAMKDRLSLDYLLSSLDIALAALQAKVQFAPRQQIWLLLAAVPWLASRTGPQHLRYVPVALLGVGLVTIPATAGTMFASHRSLHVLLPLFALAGAFGLDALQARISTFDRPHLPRHVVWLIRRSSLVLSLCALWLFATEMRPYGERTPYDENMAQSLENLDGMLGGEPVASDVPWQVLAYTSSPTIILAENGEQAIEKSMQKYGIRWLLITDPRAAWLNQSKAIVSALTSGKKRKIGGLSISRVDIPSKKPMFLFRVEGE